MVQNYTPLDVKKFTKSSSFDINTVFLFLILFTLVVLAVLLFILIQKKMQELAYVGFFT